MADKKKKVTTTTVTTTTVTEEIVKVLTNNKTHIICILDRSGSMASIMNDSIGGFNTFLKQQRELPGEATISVALFDDKYELVYDNVDIKKAENLTDKIWFARGTTALYDALGKTINTEKANLAKFGDEKPAKVLVCIVTDGQENASHEFKIDDIRKLIKDCEDDNWNFLYLAANQDAFAVGSSFGVSVGNTLNFTASGAGVGQMYNTAFASATSYRSMDVNSNNFKKMSKSLVNDDPDFLVRGSDGTTNLNNLLNTTGSINTTSVTGDITTVTSKKDVPFTLTADGSNTNNASK